MSDKIIMKKAHMKDLDTIYEIILECAEWLKSRGIKQWNPPYPKNKFEKDISEGKVYSFVSRNRIIGTVTLSRIKPYYYPQTIWSDNADTLYITKLAVPRKLKNLGVGKKLLVEIEKEAKARKIKKLILDVPEHNKKLQEYYLDSGYIQVEKIILRDTPSVFMEKEILKK